MNDANVADTDWSAGDACTGAAGVSVVVELNILRHVHAHHLRGPGLFVEYLVSCFLLFVRFQSGNIC